MSIKTVVVGAGGYVGGELLRLISTHPELSLCAAVSDSRAGQAVSKTFPNLTSALLGSQFVAMSEWNNTIEAGDDVALFSAAPHGASAKIIAGILQTASEAGINIHIVDSSADFRFANQTEWESIYGGEHGAPQHLSDFSCAVPEHLKTVSTSHVGHPGCFATATLLAAVPLLQSAVSTTDLYVSGVTGSTGSGRSPQAGTHHPERNSNLYAYKPLTHRHAPEVAALAAAASGRAATVNFVPHSGPFARGIHITLQAKCNAHISFDALRNIYEEAYQDSPFVSVVDGTPRIKNVVSSNHCHIGLATDGDSIVVMSAIDNLVKGAAGGSIQWMNRLWGLAETSGLQASAPGWT